MTIDELIAEGKKLQSTNIKNRSNSTKYHTWTNESVEPVTICDQSKELVANNDQLVTVENTSEEDIDIAKLIVVVRGQ